jgi:hypothetical protein
MTTRHLIAYCLIVVLVAGLGWALWAAIYRSKRSVRHRRRRERQARRDINEPEERPE